MKKLAIALLVLVITAPGCAKSVCSMACGLVPAGNSPDLAGVALGIAKSACDSLCSLDEVKKLDDWADAKVKGLIGDSPTEEAKAAALKVLETKVLPRIQVGIRKAKAKIEADGGTAPAAAPAPTPDGGAK